MTAAQRRAKGAHREVINLRVTPEQKSLIDRAAAALGKTRTDFMLDCAREAAINAILDQRYFELSDTDFEAFKHALDEPVEPNPALTKLLKTPAPWEK